MTDLLIAESISKSYGKKWALNDFSLSIPRGSIYGLLGPNGAGKTTFIRIINQISVPDSGRIIFDGQTLSPQHISRIGYMPEERGLYKNMKVGEQAIYLAQLKGMSQSEARKRLKIWFDKWEISDWWNKKLSELSKGMGQKIQFIVTVLHQPDLLIFDEPFSGFDPVNANLIRDEILALKEKGTTIIFSTHRMESVEDLCDYVALIDQSNKVLDGEIDQVRSQFKEGKYFVEMEINNPMDFDFFKKNHNVEMIKQLDKRVSFFVYAPQQDEPPLLNQLINLGEIRDYHEEIPTMNQVFLNAVKENK